MSKHRRLETADKNEIVKTNLVNLHDILTPRIVRDRPKVIRLVKFDSNLPPKVLVLRIAASPDVTPQKKIGETKTER